MKNYKEILARMQESDGKSIRVSKSKLMAVFDELSTPQRRSLPSRRPSETSKIKIGGSTLYLTTSEFESGELAEIFLASGRYGSAFRSMMEAYAMVFSIALQYGVPLKELVDAFKDTRFEPSGVATCGEERIDSKSILDLIAKTLEGRYLCKNPNNQS